MRQSYTFLFGLALWPAFLSAQTFSTPQKFTDGTRKYQMTRTSSHTMAFDSMGRLHLTYWSGGGVTTPTAPSYVYHRSWTAGGGWTVQEAIDDSEQTGQHVGGRHPTLALLPSDTVWITWHDHRHGTSGGSWIDNIEIYGDSRTALGTFSPSDIRLTTSIGPGSGLNGYTQRICVNPLSGIISIAWYDFETNGSVSDIYLKSSDGAGNFNLSDSFATMRSTHETTRGGTPAYTVPDMAVDGAGTRHATWAGGIGADVDLYYGSAAAGSSAVSESTLASAATDFFDPPHITAAANGDIWIAYADDTLSNNENIVLLRRRAGQPAFDPAFVVKSGTAREYSVDHAVDSIGKVHVVWVDERSGRHVYYGRYNPTTTTLEYETRVTTSAGNWIRPAILVQGSNIYVVYEQDTNPLNAGDLWFTTTFEPNAADAAYWREYE